MKLISLTKPARGLWSGAALLGTLLLGSAPASAVPIVQFDDVPGADSTFAQADSVIDTDPAGTGVATAASSTSSAGATNSGRIGAQADASTFSGFAGGETFSLTELRFDGPGVAEVDLGFSLIADVFGDPDAFAVAEFEVSGDFGTASEFLEIMPGEGAGIGASLTEDFLVTLVVDPAPFEGFFSVLTSATTGAGGGFGSAVAGARFDGIVDVRSVSVPEPGTLALTLFGIVALVFTRRQRAA